MNSIKYYESIGLSDQDLMKLVNGKGKVVLYRDLVKYRTLDELLFPYDVVFLLYETEPKWGHWNVIFRRGKNNEIVECFDPYGTKGHLDDQLYLIKQPFRKQSNQEFPQLTYLLYNSPYDIDYNEYDFQRHAKDNNTCGRWCFVRWLFKDLTLEEFCEFFKNKYGDELVTYLSAWVNS